MHCLTKFLGILSSGYVISILLQKMIILSEPKLEEGDLSYNCDQSYYPSLKFGSTFKMLSMIHVLYVNFVQKGLVPETIFQYAIEPWPLDSD